MSIIVPVFRVEKYIKKCVESLLVQTYKNIEIILIDDGSPDRCPEIIDDYEKKDDRVIVVHKKNGGVSSARNVGIRRANGKYMMFVDADDWVDADYVSYFVHLIEKSNCRIAMNKSYYSYIEKKENPSNHVVNNNKAMEMIYSDEIFVAVWNKIYETALVKDNNIWFDEKLFYGEGMLFNIECLQTLDSVLICEKKVYHQIYNPNSAMRDFSVSKNLCGVFSLNKQKRIWKTHTKAMEYEWLYHRYRFNQSIIDGLVKKGILSDYYNLYLRCVEDLRKHFLIPLFVEKSIKKKLFWIVYATFPEKMANRAKVRFEKHFYKDEKT